MRNSPDLRDPPTGTWSRRTARTGGRVTCRQPAAMTDRCSPRGTGGIGVGALSTRSAQESLLAPTSMAVDTGPCDQASITAIGPGRTMRTVALLGRQGGEGGPVGVPARRGPGLERGMVVRRPWSRIWRSNGGGRRGALAAAGFGIGGLIVVRLYTGTALGASNLDSEQPRNYDELDLEAARVIAAHAFVVLAHTARHRTCGTPSIPHLIGQAQGMLIACDGLTSDTALTVLRRYSENTNTEIALIVRQLINTGRFPGIQREINAIRNNK